MNESDRAPDWRTWEPGQRLRKLERLGRHFVGVVGDSRQPHRRRAKYVAAGLAGLAAAIAVLIFVYAILLIPFTPGIAELRKAKSERPTIVLAAGGETLVEFKPLNREWVGLEQITPEVIDALIATEDHRFYSHPGIDVWRMIGAAGRTLTGSRQGGSTITQQLARNLYPEEIGRAVSLTRKLKEIITAFKIELTYSKEEILETYLNTVPFLYNAYGIEMASRTYFSKSASELELLEGAMLVGMLKGTYYYNPVRSAERAQVRRNVVLQQMVRHEKLEADRYEALKDRPIRLRFERQPVQHSIAPHFTEHLRNWLVEWADRRGYNIYRDSLVVHTTLDLVLQEAADQAVNRWAPSLQAIADVEWAQAESGRPSQSPDNYRYRQRRVRAFAHYWETNGAVMDRFIRETPQYRAGVAAGAEPETMLDSLRADDTFMEALQQMKTRLEVGFVAMDPRTGHVKAWVGSRDYDLDQFDHVARARRQSGSTFKPFVYAAALEEGFKPTDTFPDSEVEIRLAGGEVWRPRNAGSYSNRDLTLADGLAFSKNTITAQLVQKVGTRDVARVARRMGVRQSRLDEVPSIALGTSSVSLLEMAAGYSTIASGGMYREPVLVTHIEDRTGGVIETFEPKPRRVLSEKTAFAVTDMMRGVVDRGTGTRIRNTFGIRADVAGKTGTTQGNVDGWFMLIHPNLVAGTWVGFNDARVAFRSDYWGQGGNNAAFITGEFFQRALRHRDTDLVSARFPPAPSYDEVGGGLIVRIGRWFGGIVEGIGEWFGDLFVRFFSGGDAEEELIEPGPEPDRAVRPLTEEPELDDVSEADALTRMARDSTQLGRYIERIREERGLPPVPDERDEEAAERERERQEDGAGREAERQEREQERQEDAGERQRERQEREAERVQERQEREAERARELQEREAERDRREDVEPGGRSGSPG
jgi:penicillin-binding protein 1A